MVEYAKVVFRQKDVEVSIWVSHPKGGSQESIIDKARDELSFVHDIDVQLLGNWVVTVE